MSRSFETLVVAALSAAAAAMAQAPGEPAFEQIRAVLQAKRSFTGEEKKLSSDLVFRLKAEKGTLPAGFPLKAVPPARTDKSGFVRVEIAGIITDRTVTQLRAAGARIDTMTASMVSASVPRYALAQVASIPGIRTVSSDLGARTNGMPLVQRRTGYRAALVEQLQHSLPAAMGSLLPRTGLGFVGALTTQGYISHGANLAAAHGFRGAGVRIGVLSDSASPALVAALIGTGDLPPDVVILPGQEGAGSDEGAAMMEIIHDIAPDAKLFFATAAGSQAAFANNIHTLRFGYGCDIIVDDITYFAEPAFEDGIIAQAVNDVSRFGTLYFSSAGNYGNLTSGASGTWEGDFVSTGPGTGDFHRFSAASDYDTLAAISSVILLQWSDPFSASSNDYDLFITDSTGSTLKGFSAGPQDGTQNPLEAVVEGDNCGTASAVGYCPAVGDRIYVVRHAGEPRALRLNTLGGLLSIATAGAVFGHNGGENTVSIAASYWNSARTGTRPFVGAANPVEYFSSDGPRRIFYEPDETPITPGNFLFATGGGTTLQKPDLTGADGVVVKSPGFLPFYGTSAAAPHAAAVAALVKGARPDLTNAQLKNALIHGTLDNMAHGVDRDSGYGLVMALPAINWALTH